MHTRPSLKDPRDLVVAWAQGEWENRTRSELLKRAVKRAGRSMGLEVKRYRPKADRMGVNQFADIRRLLEDIREPIVFDVGANIGESVDRFREVLPGCVVHSFE